MSTSTSAGGLAVQRGMAFQNRAAAWVAAHILAEQAASPPWDLPARTTLELLRCETEQPVDDLLIVTSEDGLVFVQVKHEVKLERREDSDLASTLDQFVRQFIFSSNADVGNTWERPLRPDRDRLVLLIGPSSSAPVREHFPSMLTKIRLSAPGQAIDDVDMNQNERNALNVVREHLVRSWQHALGSNLSDDNIRQLLSLVRVHTLDIDANGAAEREAKDRLRSTVLHDATQADVTWDALVQTCTILAGNRGSVDRNGLQQVLLDAGINLQAPRSYRDDIRKLQEYSHNTTERLSDLSEINVGSIKVKIKRHVAQALLSAAEQDSVVVVGEPGAGKSGALHDLAAALQNEGRDVVFLAVDRVEAQSLGAMRNDIGLSHELYDVLRNWHGAQTAFLVIDALDAARSDQSAQTLRDLISQIVKAPNRWRVVVSIRKFDLRYNQEIRQRFEGAPPTEFQDDEFSRIRHVNIPRLGDEELGQIPEQSQELANLITGAGQTLREMLRVPFNLRLMGELLGLGVAKESLTPIQTQIELLDSYWIRRVIPDQQADAREAVLRLAADEMVKSRTLRVDRARVACDATTSSTLSGLLSSNILSEWQPSPSAIPERYVLTFSHHVLFDYAVARLLLRGDPKTFVERLESEPELVLVVRPSLVLHFQHAWFADETRVAFWKLVLCVFQAEKVPEIGKLIGPGVAAELATQLVDFEPLLTALENDYVATSNAAEKALQHTVGSLLAAPSDSDRLLVGANAGPWCELLESVSRMMRRPIAYTVRMLLSKICERPGDLTIEQRNSAGAAARRLLEFAWSQTPRESRFLIQALQAVCRTFTSDPNTSATLIRRFLEPERLAEYGHEEMPWIAREVAYLIPVDPLLVEDIYKAGFTHQEQSNAQTSMGGRIIGFTSTRSQDYGLALYGLAEVFPFFLGRAPTHATSALIVAVDTYMTQRHQQFSDEMIEEVFDFAGREARIRGDNSHIWDAANSDHLDEPIQMLDAFGKHLLEVSQIDNRVVELENILDTFTAENRTAALWRRLIICGTGAPDTLGWEIRSLAWAVPILICPDTTVEIGRLITKVFSRLDVKDRERVERAILAIPHSTAKGSYEAREWTRNRLLGCLASESLVTDDAKQLLNALKTTNNVPPNRPLFSPVEVTWEGPYTEEMYLSDEGVPVEDVPNQRIRELEQPVKEFNETHLNSSPTGDEIEAVLPNLRALRDALATADADGVHPKQRDYTWGYLAEACELITTYDGLTCGEEVGVFVRSILLEGAQHPNPAPHPSYDAQFDEFLSWGGQATRVSAARGLTWLARNATCVDETVLDTLEQLSGDPVPAVRFQVATRLTAICRTAPNLMWTILERFCCEETSRGVLQGLLSGPLRQLAGSNADRVAALTKTIYNRVTDGPGLKPVREACVSIFFGLYLWQENQLCQEIIFGVVNAPDDFVDEAQRIVLNLRDSLTYGPISPPDPTQDAVRKRAFGLMERVLDSTYNAIHQLEFEHQDIPFEFWESNEQEQARALVQLIDSISLQLYFASGAFEKEKLEKGKPGQVLDIEKKRRFLDEAGTLLDQLAELGIPNVVHNLLKTLESLVPLDPSGLFLRIGQVVQAGRAGGYQYESLAVNLIVSLIERYLAEYRIVFRENEECQRALLEILDVFVDAGWASAQRLTYRLEEIFR